MRQESGTQYAFRSLSFLSVGTLFKNNFLDGVELHAAHKIEKKTMHFIVYSIIYYESHFSLL